MQSRKNDIDMNEKSNSDKGIGISIAFPSLEEVYFSERPLGVMGFPALSPILPLSYVI